MSDAEKLFEKVVRETGRSPEEIKDMITKRKAATHGLLSDYGALYAVAKEFGLEMDYDRINITKLSEIRPKAAMNVAGRVKSINPAKEFQKKDGGIGRIASLVLADDSGEARLVLWDSNAELAGKVSLGDIILVRNGYGKENLRGGVEVQAGSMSSILVNPKISISLPEITEKAYKISELAKDLSSVDLLCRVKTYYPATSFRRPDGTEGLRAAFIGEDETGTMRVVLWGEAAKTQLERGDYVWIRGAYTKQGKNKDYELQVGARSSIEKTADSLDLPQLTSLQDLMIRDVKPDLSGFSVGGRVVRVYEQRPYSNGMMASIILGDETGTMRVVLWNEKADAAGELKRGDAVRIRNAYSKANFNNEPEIHVSRYSEILQSQDLDIPSLKEIEKSLIVDKKIFDLQNNDKYVRIRGAVSDLDESRGLFYMTCSVCSKKVQNIGDVWFCENCNNSAEPVSNIKVSLTVEDDTGSIRAIAFRDNAEKLIGMDREELMNIVGETQDESEPARRIKESLVGKPITLVGRVRYSEFSDQLEFIVEEAE